MEESLKLIQVLGNSFAKNDLALLKEVGGVNGFKEKFANLIRSKDDTVSGFAATVLAIAGDLNYAPQIAALLEKNEKASTDEDSYPTITARGRAATALGLLGAKEFKQKIVPLLHSKNRYDRAGAAIALGYLGAREHAKDIVNLLLSKEFSFPDDDSPIYSLVQMGVAADYKKEIAQVLNEDFRSDTSKTAAYVLAHLRAKEYAKEIAKLLTKEFRKGDAAKALAIMGAREYAPNIALMLNDKSGLNRSDALLALGVLNVREYVPEVARHLNDKEGYVRHFAAVALVLMEAADYAKEAIGIIEKDHQSGPYVSEGNFHELVIEDGRQINDRFKASMALLKLRN
ncbi:MAG: HEAT repeat domain-containing protein [Pyrinomonadaceae bacterium]